MVSSLSIFLMIKQTCAALDGKPGMEGTAKFVKYVTRIWNILNIKSCDIAVRLNDPDRQKFTDPKNSRLNFLLKMATMFQKMDKKCPGKTSQRLDE